MSLTDTLKALPEHIQAAYETPIGGAADTAGLGAIGLAALASSPMFLGLPPFAPAALAGLGSGWLAHRLSNGWRDRSLLNSQLNITSADLPEVPPDESGVLLGYTTDDGRALRLPYDGLTRHGLIVGQSGVGKTVAGSLMLFQQVQRGGGLLFVDGKVDADNLRMIYQYAAWCGRAHDVLVINPGDPSRSNTYNPALYGDPDEVASRILSTIPSTESNAGADFYKQASLQGLVTLVGALQRAGLAYHVMDLSILLTNPYALADLEKKVNSVAAGSFEARNLSLFLEQFKVSTKPGVAATIDMKKVKDIFGGIGGRLFTFGTGNFGKVMNTYDPDVNLFEAIRNNKIIYCALPTMGKAESAKNFGKILLGDLRTAVSWIQSLPVPERPWPPFMSFLDEFGSYATPAVQTLFEQARSAHVFMMPAVQTLANIKAVSPELSEMVVGNTWTKIFFKLGTQETAEEAADLIGMTKVAAKSLSYSSNQSSSASYLKTTPDSNKGDGGGFSYSEREDEDYRVSPDDLKALGKGECIVTYGGDAIYNIRVPMMKLTAAAMKELGEPTINRKRPAFVKGADFLKNADRYMTKGDLDE